ncbi:MAG TPA: glycosyltransferase family 2 protein, partial [Syntrophomonas sp.]|nr:glycosyltransferase family 2 protein [Syntrophomonas sp.]
MIILFWLAAGLLVFHYFGYPLLMGLLSHLKKNKPFPESGELPPLTMIISVYNEEDVIRERLENCLTLDYPRDKLRILVVSDGSTDNTHSIVEQYSQHGIELVVVPGRVGKTGTLNQVIPELASEIIVFTDANSMLRPDALKTLVRHFADPKVGAVCGELQLTGDAGVEGAYWRYEKAIKEFESKVSTLTVANGALYALRRSLHRPMNPQAANDFQHPLQVALQGYRS